MDDYNPIYLNHSKIEWREILINYILPRIIEGFHGMSQESIHLCQTTNQSHKYLLVLQCLFERIPKWNDHFLEKECKRIIRDSKCSYLPDILTAVYIIEVKLFTMIRVGKSSKKITVRCPKFQSFIHKCYIYSARTLFRNIYLFQRSIPPLQIQKNNSSIEKIITDSILTVIRDSVPTYDILQAYLDSSIEEDIIEEIKEEIILNTPLPSEFNPDTPILNNTMNINHDNIDDYTMNNNYDNKDNKHNDNSDNSDNKAEISFNKLPMIIHENKKTSISPTLINDIEPVFTNECNISEMKAELNPTVEESECTLNNNENITNYNVVDLNTLDNLFD